MRIFDEINRMSKGNQFSRLYENKRYKFKTDKDNNWYTTPEDELERKKEARDSGPMGKRKPGKIENFGNNKYMFVHNGVHYTFNTLEDAKRERVLLGRLVPHHGYGSHIKVVDDDGEYSTKNISPFGARTLFNADSIHGKGKPVDLDLRKARKKY
jgi:hypothetical protein